MPEEKEVKAPKVESDAKKEFKKVIAEYKKQNPEKYALKKEALEAKLKSL